MSSGRWSLLKSVLFLCLALFILLPIVAGANTGQADFAETAFSLSVHKDKITAHLDQAPLQAVLMQLARHFRFGLHFEGTNSKDVISAQLWKATLEEAIRKLLIGKDYAFVKSRASREENSTNSSLVMLFVIPRNTGHQNQPRSNLAYPIADNQDQTVVSNADSNDSVFDMEPAEVQKIAEDFLVSDIPNEREAAVEVLAELDSPEARRLLSQALRQDPDEFVRARAAKALGDSWDPQFLDSLTEALFKDPDVDVRINAAEAIGEIGDPQAIFALQKALEDGNPEVRGSAVEALGDFADSQAISLLRSALADPDPEVRESAAYQLETLSGVGP